RHRRRGAGHCEALRPRPSRSSSERRAHRRVARGSAVITGLAHTAVCVPDMEAAIRWYGDVLGLRVLSPPYRMEGEAIERDMGELVPSPVVITAAILGTDDGDRVIELVEYPNLDLRSV